MNEAPGWVILQRIAAKLAAIAVAGGYFTDAGVRVDLERINLTEADTFPRIALAEDSSTVNAQTYSSTGVALMMPMVVLIEGYLAADDDDAERQAHRLKYDISHALTCVRASDFAGIEGAIVSKFEATGDRPTLRRPDGLSFVVVQVRATVTFSTFFPPVPGT